VHRALAEEGLVSWIERAEPFEARFEGSPLRRPKRAGLARNAAIVLGNRPSDRGHRALLHALSFDPSAMVRESAAWALAEGYAAEAATRPALERAVVAEEEPTWKDALRQTLARCP